MQSEVSKIQLKLQFRSESQKYPQMWCHTWISGRANSSVYFHDRNSINVHAMLSKLKLCEMYCTSNVLVLCSLLVEFRNGIRMVQTHSTMEIMPEVMWHVQPSIGRSKRSRWNQLIAVQRAPKIGRGPSFPLFWQLFVVAKSFAKTVERHTRAWQMPMLHSGRSFLHLALFFGQDCRSQTFSSPCRFLNWKKIGAELLACCLLIFRILESAPEQLQSWQEWSPKNTPNQIPKTRRIWNHTDKKKNCETVWLWAKSNRGKRSQESFAERSDLPSLARPHADNTNGILLLKKIDLKLWLCFWMFLDVVAFFDPIRGTLAAMAPGQLVWRPHLPGERAEISAPFGAQLKLPPGHRDTVVYICLTCGKIIKN